MKIKLTNEYYLLSDSHQYIIAKEKTRNNKTTGLEELYFAYETFHKTAETALYSYLQNKVRASDCDSVEGLLKEITKANKEGKEWMKIFRLKVGD